MSLAVSSEECGRRRRMRQCGLHLVIIYVDRQTRLAGEVKGTGALALTVLEDAVLA